MPTYLRLLRFNRDWERLTSAQRARFRLAIAAFVADLRKGEGFRPGLRVKKMSGFDVWEMSWAPDGRATFSYGPETRPGEAHIVWHRIGAHEIFRKPE
jgi:hypothetical protein